MQESRTTCPPCVDIRALFPDIGALGRDTYRLHWGAERAPNALATRFSGPIAWPDSRPWPLCEEHGQPFTPVLQVRAEDVPSIEFYPDTDLLQVLWCACEHGCDDVVAKPHSGLTGWTKVAVFWNRCSALGPLMRDVPIPTEHIEEYVPISGEIIVERVVEYPGLQELPPDLQRELRAHDGGPYKTKAHPDTKYQEYFAEGFHNLYQNQLSASPGTKIGGYVSWIQYPTVPFYDCGELMDHLLTIASTEYDYTSYPRWRPTELADGVRDSGHGLHLGDSGSIHVFVCRVCTDWPIKWTIECS